MDNKINKLTTSQEQSGLLGEVLNSLEPVLGFFSDYPFAVSLVVLSISLIVAKLATIIMDSVIARLASKTKIQWDDELVKLLHRPVFWTLFLVGLLAAALPLKLSITSYEVIQSVVVTVLIILWTRFLLRFVKLILHSMSVSVQTQSQGLIRSQTQPLFQNLAYIIILIFAIYLIFRSWNVDMTAWLASAGIAGIAIGFAAKDTLANLFSGVFILADGPYKIDDYVVLDSGERGKVTHIGIRSTRLLTRDDVEITIPNAVMGNTRISNESGGPHEKFRVRVAVGVAYGSDIDQVKALLMDVATKEQQVCDDPEPRVRFRSFGASSLDVELLVWVENPEVRGRVLDALNTTIYKRFNAEGIEIPYSKHDVFIKEMPEFKSESG